MKTMLKFQMLAAVCFTLTVGAISCSEETRITDEPVAPDSEYKSEPKTVRIYGEIDPVATINASGSTMQTRAPEDGSNYYLYEGAKWDFVSGDTVGFYSEGGDLTNTLEDGTTGPFRNIPMAYGRVTGSSSSFASEPEAMDADMSNFGFKFIYWPYTKEIENPGMEVRDERGYTKDVLFAMRASEKDLKFRFQHAFTMLSIARGEGFDKPQFKQENFTEEARKAYEYARQNYDLAYAEDGAYYIQVKLNYPIRYMSFPDEPINAAPDDYCGLTPLKYYVDDASKDKTDWSVFDGFKKNAPIEIDGIERDRYTVLVPATWSDFFRDYSSSNGYNYKRLEIASISLFDNEGAWVTVSDINLPRYDKPEEFVGKLLRGGYRYPLTVAYTGLKPSIFPATIEKWNEQAWTDNRPAGVNQDNFDKFVEDYNRWKTQRPITDNTTYDLFSNEMRKYANVKKIIEEGTEKIKGVELDIFLSGDIDVSAYAGKFSNNYCYIEKFFSTDIFNGGGHTISGCHMTNARGSGFIDQLDGTLRQLNFSGFTINSTTSDATGVFCRELGAEGKVENCRAEGVTISTKGPVGAIAGTRAAGSTVKGCTVRGYLEGTKCDEKNGSGEPFSGGTGETNNFRDVFFQDINQ